MTPTQKRVPKLHGVEIQVNGTGFGYVGLDASNAISIRVRRGDHVKWKCGHGHFSILFQKESPFAEIGAHGRQGDETGVMIVSGKPGSYKYGVTVALETALLVDDPEIIIDSD